MREIIINGNDVDSKRELHKILKKEFGFADYYGHNLDALNDMLSEIDSDTHLVIFNFKNIRKKLDDYSDAFLDVLENISAENEKFSFNIIDGNK